MKFKSAISAALAACLSVSALSAGAATVLNAASVTITSALPDYLQVAELLAFDFASNNVALASNGATATALSQFFPGDAPQGGPAEAIDGFYPANYDYTVNPATPGVYHSGGAGASEYLTVTFAAPKTLASISIYGRGECCQTRDFYNVTVRGANNAVLFTGQLDARTTGSATVTFDQPSAAPEPAAWAMMIGGFAGAGAMLRRRRSIALAI